MMVSNHIDSNWPHSCPRLAGVQIVQSRRGIAALNMENGPREGMKIGSNV